MKKKYWWYGEHLAEFFRLGASMEGSEFRVEFEPKEEFGLKIIPAAESKGGRHEFNVVHVCPPDCPD